MASWRLCALWLCGKDLLPDADLLARCPTRLFVYTTPWASLTWSQRCSLRLLIVASELLDLLGLGAVDRDRRPDFRFPA